MSDRIQEVFGLKRRPFTKEVPADLLWMDTGRTASLDRLADTVPHRQHALLVLVLLAGLFLGGMRFAAAPEEAPRECGPKQPD